MIRYGFAIAVFCGSLVTSTKGIGAQEITKPKSPKEANLTNKSDEIDSDVTIIKDQTVNSPKESLRVKWFGKALNEPGCHAVSQSDEKELEVFIESLIQALKAQKETALLPLFHPRLNIAVPAIAEMFAKLNSSLERPLEISVYRLWALNTVDGSPKGLSCKDDELTVNPQYGYPLQLGLWLQVVGKKETGRIYISIVPADGRWNLGAFHTQQWTHLGSDYKGWTEEAQKDLRQGQKEASYIKLDLAKKLLDSGSFIDLGIRSDIIKAQETLLSKEQFEQSIRKNLFDYDVIYVASLLVLDGAGILVRLRMPEEISVVEIKEHCKKIAQRMAATSWGKALGGVRCGFHLPKEDPNREGVLGGIYQSFKDL